MADQWNAIYRNTTGELVSVGTVVADPLPTGLTALVLAAEPDFGLVQWDVPTRAFVALPGETDDDVLLARPPRKELNPTVASGKLRLLALVDERVQLAQAWDWFSVKAQADAGLTAPKKAAIAAEALRRYELVKVAIALWAAAT